MAYAIDLNADPAGLPGRIARLRRDLADYRSYRATRKALRALSDRQLADIGLSRRKVRTVARAATYAS